MKPVTAGVILAKYGVDRKTLDRWIDLGLPHLGGPGMWRRFYLDEVEAWLRAPKQGEVNGARRESLTLSNSPTR